MSYLVAFKVMLFIDLLAVAFLSYIIGVNTDIEIVRLGLAGYAFHQKSLGLMQIYSVISAVSFIYVLLFYIAAMALGPSIFTTLSHVTQTGFIVTIVVMTLRYIVNIALALKLSYRWRRTHQPLAESIDTDFD